MSESRGSNENLLVGGAARAAQSIVVPNPALKLRQTQEGAAIASSLGGQRQGDECSNRATATAAAGRCAQAVIDASALHASHAYTRVCSGYMDEGQRYHVAAALRLLEHELFLPSEGGHAQAGDGGSAGAGAEDENQEKTSAVAPMLLPRDTARKLILQWKREEAKAAALVAAPITMEALMGANNERRRTMAGGQMVRVLSMEDDSDTSSGSVESSTPTPSRPVRERRRGHPASSGARSPSRGGHRSPKQTMSPQASARGVMKQRSGSRMSKSSRQFSISELGELTPSRQDFASKMSSSPRPQEPQRPAFMTDLAADHLEDFTTWPTSVRGLFDSVDMSGRRVRAAARACAAANHSRTGFMPKSKSTGALSSTFPARGAMSQSTALTASGRVCARPADPAISLEGWRLKLPPPGSESACRHPGRQTSESWGEHGHLDRSAGGRARRCGPAASMAVTM
uniref:Uncharacterized protein n=1 Tax=Alexandrium catenella TaxID=2925 RepID=A0A7S1RJ12_ALECA